jgi:hypothetical protein
VSNDRRGRRVAPTPSRDREQRDPEPLMQLDVAAGHACAVGADPAFGASEPARPELLAHCRIRLRLSRKFVPGVVDEHDALRG